jgi:NADH pyrophosphatase NudC (nudix superfamily)
MAGIFITSHLHSMESNMLYCPQCAQKLHTEEVDGRERLKCSSASCDFVYWDNPTPVVAGIVEIDGCVVLTRNKGWPEKWFGIVAGFLEKGETPEEAVLREVKEELGLDTEIASFVGHYSFFERNQLILAYHIQAEGDIQIGDELEAVKLVPIDEVRPWPMGTGPALRDWLEARRMESTG